ncbi:MAG TPA: hypothetical protein VIQ62_08460, partial [Burkholderiales bacterium]
MKTARSTRRATAVDMTHLAYDNSFVRELPADPVLDNVPRTVLSACYTRVGPTPVAAPKLLAWSDAVAEMLGIAPPASATGPT